jgi:uncharacterized protein (TIGR03437 family)
MDAAQLTRKLALFLAGALLSTGVVHAQTLTANPTSVTFTAFEGQRQVQLTMSDSSAQSFTIANTAGWFTVTPSQNTTPATLTISRVADCTTTAAGCNTSFTVTGASQTVTINVANSSTTTGTGVLTATPNPLTLSALFGSFDQKTITLSTSNVSAVNFTVSFTPTNSWLQVISTSSSVVSGSPVTLQVTALGTLVPSNNTTYNGTITVTPTNATSALNIPVSFVVGTGSSTSSTITANPSSVALSYPNSSSQQVLVQTTNSSTYSASTSASWLLLTQGTSQGTVLTNLPANNNLTLSVYAPAAALLTSGTTGSVILRNDTDQSLTTISVSLSINGSNVTGAAAPASLSLAHQRNSAQPLCQTIVAPATGAYGVSTSGTPAFLSTSGPFTGPGTVQVCPVVTNLTANTYQNTITLTSPDGLTQSIPVSLTVYDGVVIRAIVDNTQGDIVCPAGVSCSAHTLQVVASDGSSVPITVASSATWVVVSGTGPSTPATFQVQLNTGGLSSGVNTANITITASSGAANTQLVVPVAAVVSGNSGGGTLTLNPTSMTFNTPGSQTLSVTATTQTSFALSTPSTCAWLTTTPAGGTLNTPQTITVTVASSGLTPGSPVTCNITLGSQSVPVTFNVPGGGASGNISVAPTELRFDATPGNNPASKTLQVTATGGATGVGFTASASPSTWLSVTPSNGTTTSGTITVSINVTGLSNGTQTGSITIAATGGNTITVPVTLVISPATTVSASPATLSFSYIAGSANPTAQQIQVTGTGQNLPFTATVSAGAEWLTVTPASGTAPANLSVQVNPAGLTPRTYTATITVAGSGTATGSTAITVTLEVTAPLPTISRVTNAASFNTGSIAAGEVITIFGVAMGPTTLAVAPQGQFPTSLGGVSVTVGGYAAPLIYVRNDQISAIVPYEINRPFLASATVLVRYLGQSSNGVSLSQVGAAPGIFTIGGGTGQGAILNQNLTVNSAANPADKGQVIVLYVTGEGQTNPAGVTGRITPNTPPFAQPASGGVTVMIGGQPATVQFYGAAPNLVSGVMQVNAVVPQTVASGALPVVVMVGTAPSQLDANGVGAVTVAVR